MTPLSISRNKNPTSSSEPGKFRTFMAVKHDFCALMVRLVRSSCSTWWAYKRWRKRAETWAAEGRGRQARRAEGGETGGGKREWRKEKMKGDVERKRLVECCCIYMCVCVFWVPYTTLHIHNHSHSEAFFIKTICKYWNTEIKNLTFFLLLFVLVWIFDLTWNVWKVEDDDQEPYKIWSDEKKTKENKLKGLKTTCLLPFSRSKSSFLTVFSMWNDLVVWERHKF